jgi:hypothetical protein
MKRKSLISLFAGLLVAAVFAAGPAPTGVAQLLKRCLKKAKKKFRNSPAKKEAAIKKCKKKYR